MKDASAREAFSHPETTSSFSRPSTSKFPPPPLFFWGLLKLPGSDWDWTPITDLDPRSKFEFSSNNNTVRLRTHFFQTHPKDLVEKKETTALHKMKLKLDAGHTHLSPPSRRKTYLESRLWNSVGTASRWIPWAASWIRYSRVVYSISSTE